MTKSKIRSVAVMCVLTAASITTLSIDLKSQGLGDLLRREGILGNKKPKDFNKPPDLREFQQPVNGEFKANTMFFEARSDDERCQSIDLWLSSVRYEASQSPSYRNRKNSYLWNNDVLKMESVNSREIPKFGTPAFRNIFGKGLNELSEKDFKHVSKFLEKCSHQRWVANTLERWFTYPAQMQDWVVQFGKMEEVVKQEKIEAEKRLYRERYQAESRRIGYSVAELIKETDNYRLHAAFWNNGNTEWCSQEDRQAIVSLIHKVDENYQITSEESYWKKFENEIRSEVTANCANAEKIYVVNFVSGFYIYYDQNQINTRANGFIPSDPHSIAVYFAKPTDQGKYLWINGDKLSSLTMGNFPRSSNQNIFPDLFDDSTDDSRLASISGLREILKTRQAKLDEEAKIRAEKASAEEAARRAEIARKAETHRVQLATGGFSAKGLKNEELFANIFLGDFEALPFQRDNTIFGSLFGAYLKSYAEYCPGSLPSNKVEMTRQECATERITRNGWGVETSRSCIEWRTVRTGLYADPSLYAAKTSVDRAQATKILNPKSGGGILGGIAEALTDFASGKTLNEMGKALDVSSDVAPLVSMNACAGPGLKRFQENLRRFALNERPLLDSLPSARTEAPPAKTKSEKPQTVIQKSKPATKKTTVKSRRKN